MSSGPPKQNNDVRKAVRIGLYILGWSFLGLIVGAGIGIKSAPLLAGLYRHPINDWQAQTAGMIVFALIGFICALLTHRRIST